MNKTFHKPTVHVNKFNYLKIVNKSPSKGRKVVSHITTLHFRLLSHIIIKIYEGDMIFYC